MKIKSESEIIQTIDEALTPVEDEEMRERILQWAYAKFGKHKLISPTVETPTKKVPTKSKRSNGKGKSPKKTGLSILKDLNLTPSNDISLKDFAEQKKPSNQSQKCLISVYYLQNKLSIDSISTNHVYTCFKNLGWRIPANLNNALQFTASTEGWLDTSSMVKISVTTIGENFVEHDMPSKLKIS